MSTRYFSNLTLALIGGFLVVATMAFAPVTAAWLTFAIAVGATVISLYMIAFEKSLVQRSLGGLLAILGAWTIVSSLVFAPSTVVWLGFASALAFVAVAVIGLTVHELTTERVVHSLDVQHVTRRESLAA
jgi:FtsH-binding integral membrane protein